MVSAMVVAAVAVGIAAGPWTITASDAPHGADGLSAPFADAAGPVTAANSKSATEPVSAVQAKAMCIPAYPQAMEVGIIGRGSQWGVIRLCQARTAAFSTMTSPERCGVDCSDGCACGGGCGEARWCNQRPIPLQPFAHGEYVGPTRTSHVWEYRLRVDDQIDFVYRLTRDLQSTPYELNVGDSLRVESFTDKGLDRDLIVQPDGTITLRLLGQVRAARRTVDGLRAHLEESYKKFYKVPAITVTPLKVNTRLNDLRDAIDSRAGVGGQSIQTRVAPDGTIQLPALGPVPAQGLSLKELKVEIDERYNQVVKGMEVTPVLTQRAPRYVYVLGEVTTPGRYELTGPTTVMQSVALAGGWNHGGNLHHIVVFRRAEDWRLTATRLDLNGAMLGKRPCPADEIWVRDSDIVLVPKSSILQADDFIDLVFTRGIYGVLPFSSSWSISTMSTL